MNTIIELQGVWVHYHQVAQEYFNRILSLDESVFIWGIGSKFNVTGNWSSGYGDRKF
jgi:hypothetical protein